MPVKWASQDERRDVSILGLGWVLILAALFAAYLLGQAGRYAASETPERVELERVDQRPACYEDEPCWDCRTMGNRVCGPVQP